jgi:hypothetical protein
LIVICRIGYTVPGITVVPQPFEDCQCVKLKLSSSDPAHIMGAHFPEGRVPAAVDFRVARKGTVQALVSWRDCEWDQGMEDTTLAFLNWMADRFRECL